MLGAAGVALAGAAAYQLLRCRRRSTVEKATVHLFPPTTCSRRVLMCLAELECEEGREFVINLVSTAGPNKTAAHMRLQPFGKIPAWQEGDWVLYASQHGHTPASTVPKLSSCASLGRA